MGGAARAILCLDPRVCWPGGGGFRLQCRVSRVVSRAQNGRPRAVDLSVRSWT